MAHVMIIVIQIIYKFYDIAVKSKIKATWIIALRDLLLINLVKVQLTASYEMSVKMRF